MQLHQTTDDGHDDSGGVMGELDFFEIFHNMFTHSMNTRSELLKIELGFPR